MSGTSRPTAGRMEVGLLNTVPFLMMHERPVLCTAEEATADTQHLQALAGRIEGELVVGDGRCHGCRKNVRSICQKGRVDSRLSLSEDSLIIGATRPSWLTRSVLSVSELLSDQSAADGLSNYSSDKLHGDHELAIRRFDALSSTKCSEDSRVTSL